MRNTWWSTLLLVGLGAFTFWLWQRLDEGDGVAAQVRPHKPDYYIEKMIRNSMDKNGELRNILHAERVVHYPDDDSTELSKPRMEIYNGRSQPWHVVSDSGWVSSGNEVVLLKGDVEIWRLDDDGRRELEVLTTELRVLPKEKYAETDNAATITSQGTVTKTVGMRANFAHDRLELLNNVRTRYEMVPPQS
jgi:lipopolysaccharide export system protein LptC